MSTSNKLLQAASGGADDPVYVEDVFSTFLYTGTGATLAIDNGLDLSGEGGLVWLKGRGAAQHRLFDTARGANKYLTSQGTDAEVTKTDNLMSFNSNGFTLGADSSTSINGDGSSLVSWSWRKQPGFFDVQTWTGNATAGRQISHNLGCVPGFIITKRIDQADNWKCYHVGSDASNPQNYVLELDSASGRGDESIFNDTAPTATNFTISAGGAINASGGTFVAYIFAGTGDSGSQIFGDDSDEAIIKCGSFTSDGSGISTVDLGFEPQLLLCKTREHTDNWQIWDIMRGMSMTEAAQLYPNDYSAETARTSSNHLRPVPTSTGFIHYWSPQANRPWIFMAIRRPMKAPEYGTDVFAASAGGSSGLLTFDTNFRVDFNWLKGYTTTSVWYVNTRLTGERYIAFDSNNQESSLGINWDRMTGWQHTSTGDYSAYFGWSFKRAKGFLDVVAYTSNTTYPNTFNHNLGVVPELILIKRRDGSSAWAVYSATLGNTKHLVLSSNAGESGSAYWNNTTPTSTVVTVGGQDEVWGYNGYTYIAYLFATVAGVSKVGSYSGTGSTINVDCGFSAGARFVSK
jgi:hypothetical protein